jgi:hypothetical protein
VELLDDVVKVLDVDVEKLEDVPVEERVVLVELTDVVELTNPSELELVTFNAASYL